MPRKKENNIDEEVTNKEPKGFIYCGLRKCIHTECHRHSVNTPFGVVLYRKDFNPDKDWNCKDMEV